MSLHSDDGTRFVGLANYAEMLTSEDTRRALANNAIWVLVAPTVVTALGLVFAVLTERVTLVNAFRLVLFMPMAISFLAAGVTFRMVYDEDPNRGLLNAALVSVHDSFAEPSPYPGATVREDPELRAVDGAIHTTTPVSSGEVVLLPLVGLPADEVPDEAAQAAAPAPGPGVSGLVWRDFLRGGEGTDGAVDPGEYGLPGVSVEALQGGTVVAETVTGADGSFAFPELAGGGYTVRLAAGNFTEPYRGLTWLGPGLVTPAIIGSYIWVWAGFAMVVISAGFSSIPRAAVESARLDGASEWQVLRLITIPLLRPVLAVVVVTLVINVLKIFDLVLVLAPESVQPEANVLGLEMYHASFTRLNAGLGSAIAVLLFALVLPGMAWRARMLRRQERRGY
ncbi:ABC transporter permease subunit [Natronosporangium hydrolyticum]|uniref:ABC transporter permease subunit n=2 Tax=Natronosporangium hydrolyticum TaxID=2811111 RepID=A0A895YNB5_9ACTN|nr:ABC transporter permease subunit [Natronosporangium hydrolyticum]